MQKLRNKEIVVIARSLMLDARCPDCSKKAQVNDEMSEVKCSHCGFHATYEEYLEIMKDKAASFADEFHMSSSSKRPF